MSIRRRSGGEYVLMKEARTPVTFISPLDGYGLIIDNTGLYGERVVDQDILFADRIPLLPRWTHVVFVYDGAQQLFYVDGMLAAQTPDVLVMRQYAADFTLGSYSAGFASADGFLDELAVYDHALGADRVAVHHDVGVNGP